MGKRKHKPKRAGDYKGHGTAAIWYPNVEGNRDHVLVELMSVRSADDLRIEYDFERDGYVIKQARWGSWQTKEQADMPAAEGWEEVAFIQAWGREAKCPNLQDGPGPCHHLIRTGENEAFCMDCDWKGEPEADDV